MKIGPVNQYELSESAINHIIHGDLTDRQDKDSNNKTVLTKVIAGGLHTLDAWNDFLKCRTDVKHALLFDPNLNEKWYYARGLQNGVILLRIPRECFQGKAANITAFPEAHYVSGYLWKTLFPIEWTKEIIISKIHEALCNLDEEKCSESLLEGYVDVSTPLKTIKLRIQIRGNEILSAFPTWGQPMTGNNGKPFSHLDSINTIISGSCVFRDNDEYDKVFELRNNWSELNPQDFLKTIPEFIKHRPKPFKDKRRNEQQNERKKYLTALGRELSNEDAKSLFAIASSDIYCRHTFDAINFAYNTFGIGKSNSLELFNCYSFYENFKEFILVLSGFDDKSGSDFAFQIIRKSLISRFIRTGGLDLWEAKRLLTLFNEVILASNSKTMREYLTLLNESPMRIGAYTEFNLNQFTCKDIAIIGVTPSNGDPLDESYFYVFVALSLGLNYTVNFDHDFNLLVAHQIQKRENPEGTRVIKRCILHAIDTDFTPFSVHLNKIFHKITPSTDIITIFDDIIFDYFRCLASNVLSIIVKNRKILSEPLEFHEKGYSKFTKAKHEYQFLVVMHKIMINSISERLASLGFITESESISIKYSEILKEIWEIPMPESTPEYIDYQ